MRSATLPIVGENDRIIGLLCMNLHMEVSLHTFLNGLLETEGAEKQSSIVETYANSSDDLIQSSIETARTVVENNPSISSANRNKEIISLLNQKGIFQLKDAVLKVAKNLGITKNTVYLHLRNLCAAEGREGLK